MYEENATKDIAKNEKLNVIACHLLLQYDRTCNYCKICARASKAAKRNSRTSASNVTKQNANDRFQPCRAVETTNKSERSDNHLQCPSKDAVRMALRASGKSLECAGWQGFDAGNCAIRGCILLSAADFAPSEL